MKAFRLSVATLLALLLAGCLEAQQHPPWVHGYYSGKPDDLPQHVFFHNDRLLWAAAIANRTARQNEYNRMTAYHDTAQ